MRTSLTTLLAALWILLPPGNVQAQEYEDDLDPGESELEGQEVVDEPRPPGAPTSGRDSAPGEVHTVVRGDTLWDLSQRYLNTPWYWPKVWSYNPEIANPHWIYPGNRVRFFAEGEDVPARVEVAEAGEPGDDGLDAPELYEEDLLPPVQLTSPIGYQGEGSVMVVRDGFVTQRELEEAGRIDSAFTEGTMLSYPDRVYLSFARGTDVRLGDRYVIFRTESEIKHPRRGGRFGYLTRLLGTMRVVALSERLTTAEIENAWDVIERGDRVGPFGERLADRVSPRPNTVELDGYVVATLPLGARMVAEFHSVLVDRGSADGVQVGNTFTIIRQGEGGGQFVDPSRDQDERFPIEDIAVCMAVDVKETATTCLLVRSLREVVAGDRVVMRPEAGGPVSRR